MADALGSLMRAGFGEVDAQHACKLLEDKWYYRIQLTPEVWTTPAHVFESVALTRMLLSRAEVRGASVLDIGTMEGMIPVLARAAGANHVVAYDRLPNLRARVALVQRAYKREFEHCTGQSLFDFRRQRQEQFDVVVFSGVLYHMFDPLGGLVLAASFAKPGGLFIFESSAVVRDDCALHFNRRGRYYPGTNYFQPTPDALDHFFRFIGLAALDGEYIVQRTIPTPIIRIAVACRVVAKSLPTPDDTWMAQPFAQEFREFHLARRNTSAEAPELVKYAGPDRRRAVDSHTHTLNISNFIERYPAMPIRSELTELSLAAADDQTRFG